MEPTSESLCPTCATIPFSSLFYPPSTPSSSVPTSFTHLSLADVVSNTACPFCILIAHTLHVAITTSLSLPPPSPSSPLDPAAFFPNPASIRVSLRRFLAGDLKTLNPNPSAPSLFEELHHRVYQLTVHLTDEARPKPRVTEFGDEVEPDPHEEPRKKEKPSKAEMSIGMVQVLNPGQDVGIGSVVAERKDHQDLFLGRRVNAALDLRLVQAWLETCKNNHIQCSRDHWTKSLLPPTGMRLLDTKLWRIIGADKMTMENEGYVTLSYVWGGDQRAKLLKSNYQAWEKAGSLPQPETLPKTIRDSVALVQRLGIRYLWIDALCIIQDDSAMCMDQIEQMDRIYSSSLFTIVAADGINADAGLPGLDSGSRRSIQLIKRVGEMELANLLPSLFDSLTFSYWSTRAWTYQERILSRRSVFFTSYAAYFQCDRDSWAEDVYAECVAAHNHAAYPCRGAARLDVHPVWDTATGGYKSEASLQPSATYAQYITSVTEFRKRNMVNPNDSLRALLGLLNVISHMPGAEGFITGLPVLGFHQALLWMPLSPPKPRNTTTWKFPSWSWAAWECPVSITRSSLRRAPEITDVVAITKTENSSKEVRYAFPQRTLWDTVGAGEKPPRFQFPSFNIRLPGLDIRVPSRDRETVDRLHHTYALSFRAELSDGDFYVTGKLHYRLVNPGYMGEGFVQACLYSEERETHGVEEKWCGMLHMEEKEAKEIRESGEKYRVQLIQITREFVSARVWVSPAAEVFTAGVLWVEKVENEEAWRRRGVGLVNLDAWKRRKIARRAVRLV